MNTHEIIQLLKTHLLNAKKPPKSGLRDPTTPLKNDVLRGVHEELELLRQKGFTYGDMSYVISQVFPISASTIQKYFTQYYRQHASHYPSTNSSQSEKTRKITQTPSPQETTKSPVFVAHNDGELTTAQLIRKANLNNVSKPNEQNH